MKNRTSLLRGGRLDIESLRALTERPPLRVPGEPHFWDDPYISTQMLKAHLDPTTDAASRKPETIGRIVDWLMQRLSLHPGDRLLDLGCGPGLYCTRFAGRGLRVAGIDLSRGSIEYATREAAERALPITYTCANYLEAEIAAPGQRYKAVVLIYGDFCTLPIGPKVRLLSRVRDALEPGGYFAFDVMTTQHAARFAPTTGWQVSEGNGFWRAAPYIVLEQRLDYPDSSDFLERYIVIEEDGAAADYRIWYRLYTAESIESLLREAGFRVVEMCGDLAGAPPEEGSGWLGLVAQRAP